MRVQRGKRHLVEPQRPRKRVLFDPFDVLPFADDLWTGDAVGGGSAPAQELTGWAVAIEPGRLSVDELEEKLRLRAKPIVARIHRRQYLLCVRTIREEDFAEIAAAAAEAIR